MPSSHTYQLNEIMELVILTEPKSILDIGCGYGKFGLLCYERLNLWYTNDINNKNVKIDAIEAFTKYLTPVHAFVYDRIYIGEAIKTLKDIKEKYDLILLIDVLEHFEREDGEKLLRECLRKARNVIVSTPVFIGKQEDMFDNTYEVHRAQWDREDFSRFADYFVMPNHLSHIIYMGKDMTKVRDKSYYFKEYLRGCRRCS